MPQFVVTTWETVQGTYLVEAEDRDAAARRIGGLLPSGDWDGVDQLTYEAFAVKVRSVEEDT